MKTIFVVAALLLCIFRSFANAETNEVLVFAQGVGTNAITLTYTRYQGGIAGRQEAEFSGRPKIYIVGTRDYWRYRLYLGTNVNQQSQILWERSFANTLGAETPKDIGLLTYYIDPGLDRVVVISRNGQTAFGDVCCRTNGVYTNLVSQASSYLVPKNDAFDGRLLASAKVSPGARSGTFEVRLTTEDGLSADFVFTGSRWRTKLPDENLRPGGAAPEVVVFEDLSGSDRIVGTYARINEDDGLRMAIKAFEGRNIAGSPVPFDRKYNLKLKSHDSSKDLVLWEKCFTCDDFENGVFVGDSKGGGSHFADCAVHPLGYYFDSKLNRAVVFYSYINHIYGEVCIPGRNGATNLLGVTPFYMAIPRAAPAAVVVSSRGIPGSYQATVTYGIGAGTNILFDGKRWIPDPRKRQ